MMLPPMVAVTLSMALLAGPAQAAPTEVLRIARRTPRVKEDIKEDIKGQVSHFPEQWET